MRKYHKIPSLTYKMTTIPLKKSLKGLKYHQSMKNSRFAHQLLRGKMLHKRANFVAKKLHSMNTVNSLYLLCQICNATH